MRATVVVLTTVGLLGIAHAGLRAEPPARTPVCDGGSQIAFYPEAKPARVIRPGAAQLVWQPHQVELWFKGAQDFPGVDRSGQMSKPKNANCR
jgi:hypothetical protein